MNKEVLAEVISGNVAGVIALSSRRSAGKEWEVLIERDNKREYHGMRRLAGSSGGEIRLFYVQREYFVKNIQSPRQADHWRYVGAEVLFDKSGWACRCLNRMKSRLMARDEKRRALAIKLYDFRVLAERARIAAANGGNAINMQSVAGRIFETAVGMICIMRGQWEPMPDQVYEEVLEGIEWYPDLLELLRAPSPERIEKAAEDVERMYEENGYSDLVTGNLLREYFLPENREEVFRFSGLR